MNTLSSLATYRAKTDGYHVQRENLRVILNALYNSANEDFWLQRDTDPKYADPRTDYLLGKRDAISDLISYLNKTMANVGTTTTVNNIAEGGN
jgi:hypothetical protein